MRILLRFASAALFGALCSFVPAADTPAPLVKPVTPTNGIRARIAVADDKETNMHFKAQIHKPKGKKGEMIDVKVLIESQPMIGRVTLKQWKEWGFEVPPNRTTVLSELIIPAAQLAPKPAKGRDIEVRITNVKLDIVEPTDGRNAVWGGDLYLGLRDLTGGADRAFEPRIYFPDRFLELTVPNAAIKRLNAGDATSPDPMVTADDGLVPVVGTMTTTGPGTSAPVFTFASVNGLTQYKQPTGKVDTVNAGVSSTTNFPTPGIVMTMNTARGCGAEIDKMPRDAEPGTGKIKELRLGFHTGAGFKVQQDLVLKDVAIHVIDDKTMSFVWLGPRFIEEFFKDGVYGCGPDGIWRLHGRVKADLLQDIKTRPPAKKP